MRLRLCQLSGRIGSVIFVQKECFAGDAGARIGGGVSTIRQFLQGGLIDEMHLALRPVLMGTGEHLWHGLGLYAQGYECTRTVAGERATHLFFRKRAPS